MTVKRSVIMACLLLAGAGPATQPVDVETLQARLEESAAKLDVANGRIAELERELAALRAAPAPVAVAPAAQPAVIVVTPIRDDGTTLSLKRAVARHVKAGMARDAVVATLGEPTEKQRVNERDVYVYKRVDVGRMTHGAFSPGARYAAALTFDAAGNLETIETNDR